MTAYLTLAEVLAIHADQIECYGGSQGVRDAGLVEEAAALWESLAQNHPFIDGNKRSAFATTYTFLVINGAQLTADSEETYAFISGLYEAGTFSFYKLAPWLRRNVKADA